MTLINHIHPTLQQKHALATLLARAQQLYTIGALSNSIIIADLYNTGLDPRTDGNSLKFYNSKHQLVAEITKH